MNAVNKPQHPIFEDGATALHELMGFFGRGVARPARSRVKDEDRVRHEMVLACSQSMARWALSRRQSTAEH